MLANLIGKIKTLWKKVFTSQTDQTASVEEEPLVLDFFEMLMADMEEENKACPQGDSGYFSWENFTDLTNLQGHIDFAQQLLKAYQWPDDVQQELRAQMQLIRIKQQDKSLNMSVIGEFSSGKSTFINALLRKDLLAECVQQGTTVAATVLGYAKQARIQSKYKDGRYTRNDYENLDQLKEQLNAVVANNDEAAALDQVVVGLPLDWLKLQRFRIIDTPGLNSLNRWHDEVTVHAVQDISDVSIILTEANRPMPESLCNFIEENLSHVLQHCVFVVTKFDMIQPKERARVLKFVAVKAKQLGVEDPLVVPYASLEVLKDAANAAMDQQNPDKQPVDAELLEMCLRSEQSIFEFMGRNRAVVQAKNLVALVNRLYDEINNQLLDKTRDCEERIEALEAARTRDLKPFLDEQKEEREEQYRLAAEQKRSLIAERVTEQFEFLCDSENADSIDAKVNAVTNINKLKPLINTFESTFKETVQKALDEAQSDISSECGHCLFEAVYRDFTAAFHDQFKDLKRLEIQNLTASMHISIDDLVCSSDTTSLVRETSDAASSSNLSILLGGGGGALLAVVLLGLGPLGAFIMGVGAIFLGSSYRERKLNEAKESVIYELENYCDETLEATNDIVMKSLDEYIDSVSKQLHREIDRYYTAYFEVIKKRLQEEMKKREVLEGEVKGLRDDMKTITVRRSELSALIGRIK